MKIEQIITMPYKIVRNIYKGIGFSKVGKNVMFGKNFAALGKENITIGDNVSIGPNCVLNAINAPLTIGNFVLIGPNVTISTGEHRTDMVGEYMYNVSDDMKLSENDAPIIIEDDVCISSNVVILKGTTIGRGSVIAPGSVVSRDIKPYSIFENGKEKKRFDKKQQKEHERLMDEKYGQTDQSDSVLE